MDQRTIEAIIILAKPPEGNPYRVAAAKHLWEFYEKEYQQTPDLGEIIRWFWLAAKRHVDIRAEWKTKATKDWDSTHSKSEALSRASVNVFSALVRTYAAYAFLAAKGFSGDDPIANVMFEEAIQIKPRPIKEKRSVSAYTL